MKRSVNSIFMLLMWVEEGMLSAKLMLKKAMLSHKSLNMNLSLKRMKNVSSIFSWMVMLNLLFCFILIKLFIIVSGFRLGHFANPD